MSQLNHRHSHILPHPPVTNYSQCPISQGTHQHRAAGAIHSGRWSVTEYGRVQATHVRVTARIAVSGADTGPNYEGKFVSVSQSVCVCTKSSGDLWTIRRERTLVLLFIHTHLNTPCGTNRSLSGLVGVLLFCTLEVSGKLGRLREHHQSQTSNADNERPFLGKLPRGCSSSKLFVGE